jgi:hypothetical protein
VRFDKGVQAGQKYPNRLFHGGNGGSNPPGDANFKRIGICHGPTLRNARLGAAVGVC